MLTFKTWEDTEQSFEIDETYKGALSVLDWAYSHYGENLVYACSFGIEGIVLIDLISKVKKDATIVFLDTGLHFKETYETIDRVKERYPDLNIVLKKPSLTVEEQGNIHGDNLWERDPQSCCHIRKILPLQEVMAEYPAWISGLRREQSPTRKNTNFLNKDDKFQSIKVCPLIHWTWKDIWRYTSKHELTYNVLHDQGYPSIGCAPCTNPAFTAEDLRSGRWTGSNKTECGLHE
ncbi:MULTISPECIES: phosphoadenylyl-sulfate reductase [Bacillus]|uniref:Adenosine 5'-phosphosulfate reductase n=1 Tax=Bacillus gobiensis TaxID=1441095 RepID=A0A0M5JCS8_9BACI|nr:MULTISPECIES: phosphoadenylyl-sulfate reductase [Bacillus]ALC84107.1 phosphoadenosine phosphosulfate reductase [Bacillus gobiensis]MED1095339.1 phosphoadenylyl-sulfate reductase [Bacillus capparidis]